jgi:hypothetical protein
LRILWIDPVGSGAEATIFGCTVEVGSPKQLTLPLKLSVIDPDMVSFKFAELLADSTPNWGYLTARSTDMRAHRTRMVESGRGRVVSDDSSLPLFCREIEKLYY